MSMDKKEGKVKFWRLLQIDKAIRTKQYPTAITLAKTLEVSTRTVERDIEFLRDMYNAPIEYDKTKCGYVYTQDTFFLKNIFFTEDEFFSVVIFEKLLRQYRNTPIEKLLKSVFKKIISTLPDNSVFIDTYHLDNFVTYIADPAPDIDCGIFSAVFKAVKLHIPITFFYRSLKNSSYEKRKINPYHIICQRGVWYVVGFCCDKKDLRIFSFSRMSEIETLKDAPFEIPLDFKVEDYIDKNVGVWLTKREPFTVRLLFSSAVGVFAEEHIWSDEQKITVLSDKSVEVSFKTTQFEEIKRFCLGQGATVKVIEPEELVETIKREIADMGKMY